MAKRKKNNKKIVSIENLILGWLRRNKDHALTIKQIKAAIPKKHVKFSEIVESLDHLVQAGKVERKGKDLYMYSFGRSQSPTEYEEGIVVGKVDVTRSGSAYIVSEHMEKDIRIPKRDLLRAFDGDIVKVRLLGENNKRYEGKVVDIVKRKTLQFAGTLSIGDDFAFFMPDNDKIPVDFFIQKRKLKGAKEGDKVIAEILSWAEHRKSPEARVIRVLGSGLDNESEMLSILVGNGFPLEFSKEAMKEAEKIQFDIPEDEIARRKDMRGITTFTIDPEDAKDFDDALSFQVLDNGNYEIGIHIADVSHYVKPGSALDKDGFMRATSVYLVDRVLPMLPEKISNGVCSLRPNEDKLVYSAIFEMDDNGKIYKEWFGRCVIHSDQRFTYEQAQEVIKGIDHPLQKELITLNNIAKQMRKERYKNGSIGFDMPEIRIQLDENAKPIGVIQKLRFDAHLLVEDFMLLANKKVSQFVGTKEFKQKQIPFVYRIHDQPDPEKFGGFVRMAGKMGVKIGDSQFAMTGQGINQLLEQIKGETYQKILESLAIRSMAKAKYTTKNIGHFGLGFEYYSHFTSPIRRYPDVMVHRLLDQVLRNKPDMNASLIEEQCAHASFMERQAMDAERTSVKYKQVEYMQDKVGDVFDGVISGVTQFGLFVEMNENYCEGLVRTEDLPDDKYFFEEMEYAMIGQYKKRKFRLGDAIKVQVVAANLSQKNIDLFVWEGEDEE